MRYVALISMFLAAAVVASAQQNNVWVFGFGTGIDFNSSPARPMTGTSIQSVEASASMADPGSGRLLFYSDSRTIWNSEHQPMPNGDGLLGQRSSTQGVLIVPMPGDPTRYYVFTTDANTHERSYNGLRYSIVNISLDAGRGDVERKNVPLLDRPSEKLTAVRRCADSSFWIICHVNTDDRFAAFHVSRTGISYPVFSGVGKRYNDFSDGVGYLRVSTDGSRLAAAVHGMGAGILELFHFDLATGIVSDAVTLTLPGASAAPYGVEFSPDNSRLYVSDEGAIYQWDLTLSSDAAVRASRVTVQTYNVPSERAGAILLGPDGWIYAVIVGRDRLDAITNPNALAPDIDFRRAAISLPAPVGAGLPNHIKLGANLANATVAPHVSICAGDSAQLVASGGSTYRWWPSDGLNCLDCPDPLASPQATTTYYVAIGDGLGCSRVDSIIVTVLPLPTIDLPDSLAICSGDSVIVDIGVMERIKWSPSDGVSCDTCSSVVIRPSISRQFTVHYARDGCTGIDSINVEVLAPPTVSLAADTAICRGEAATINVGGGTAYLWSSQAAIPCDTCASIRVTPESTSVYYVTVTGPSGCIKVDSVRVAVISPPSLALDREARVCRGDTVALSARTDGILQWSPRVGLSCDDCPAPLASPTETTTYRVVAHNDTRCRTIDSVTVFVVPRPSIVIAGDSAVCTGGAARLSVSGASAYNWHSDGDALACSTCAELIVRPRSTTTYFVEGTSIDGCIARDSFVVAVIDRPTVRVSGDSIVCLGETSTLQAYGGLTYAWEPSAGLSCDDCATTIARPDTTTSYRVIGTIPGGCADTTSITVHVQQPSIASASVDRDVRLSPGQTGPMRISLDDEVNAELLTFEVTWNPTVMVSRAASLSPSMASDGWQILREEQQSGRHLVSVGRPSPAPVGPGVLVVFEVSAFVGDSTATEVQLSFEGQAQCARIETRNGSLIIDSVCGLSFRLIETSPEVFRLRASNPLTGTSAAVFTLPFDGIAQVSIADARGSARPLFEGHLTSGTHAVDLNATELPAGIYELRVRFGRISQAIKVVVVH